MGLSCLGFDPTTILQRPAVKTGKERLTANNPDLLLVLIYRRNFNRGAQPRRYCDG
jgi:hypothetical protein